MKFRQGFVSNSSSSSFMFYNPELSIEQVKHEIEKLADEHDVDVSAYDYNVIDEEYIHSVADYLQECDGILEDSDFNKVFTDLRNLVDTGQITQNEYSKRLGTSYDELYERNKQAVIEWTKTPKFQNEIKGRVHVVGGDNDPFVYEVMANEFDAFEFRGTHIHLG